MIENDEEQEISPFSNREMNQNLLEVNVNEELLMKKPGIFSNIFYIYFVVKK